MKSYGMACPSLELSQLEELQENQGPHKSYCTDTSETGKLLAQKDSVKATPGASSQ